ncbi:hypothetical protein BGZ74_001412 [Mortierella antarctica]|nr:hypothetical protein BGZ74_001412 [Mortierella antarctica]
MRGEPQFERAKNRYVCLLTVGSGEHAHMSRSYVDLDDEHVADTPLYKWIETLDGLPEDSEERAAMACGRYVIAGRLVNSSFNNSAGQMIAFDNIIITSMGECRAPTKNTPFRSLKIKEPFQGANSGEGAGLSRAQSSNAIKTALSVLSNKRKPSTSMAWNSGESSSSASVSARTMSDAGKRLKEDDRRQYEYHRTGPLSSSRGAMDKTVSAMDPGEDVDDEPSDNWYDDFMKSMGRHGSSSFENESSQGKGKRPLRGSSELESFKHSPITGSSSADGQDGHVNIEESSMSSAADPQPEPETDANQDVDANEELAAWDPDDDCRIRSQSARVGIQVTDADDVEEDSLDDKRMTRSKVSRQASQAVDSMPSIKKTRSALSDVTNTGANRAGQGRKPKKSAGGDGQENESLD